MTPEIIDNIVTILVAVIASLISGVVGARLTKTKAQQDLKNVELSYKDLYEGVNIKANRLSDKVDVFAREAIVAAEQLAQAKLAISAFSAKLELMEGQRVEYERRHLQEVSGLQSVVAVLKNDNISVKSDLDAALSKLSKTEEVVDWLRDRLNPPVLSAAEDGAIDALRDKPPASEK